MEEIELDSYGVVGDRRFMLIDGSNRFISQRRFPKLALIVVKWVEYNGGSILQITAPGMEQLDVVPVFDGERSETSIWNDSVMTIDQGEEASKWFSKYLGIGANFIRLMACANERPGYNRTVDLPSFLKGRLPSISVTLSDAAPVSLISNESLADLNQKLKDQSKGHEVPLNRFRMNIEISGCTHAFEEDEWLVIKIGAVPFLVYVANERCKMTGINQDTGEEDKLGPLEILRQYRAPDGPDHAKFGQFMIPLQKGSKVKLGDTVTVLDRKKMKF